MSIQKFTFSPKKLDRRSFLKAAAVTSSAAALAACGNKAAIEEFLQRDFRSLSKEKIAKIIERLETEYAEKYGKAFTVSTKEAIPDTLFGYGLDLSRCIGCRKCVYACQEENNQSRDPQILWIKVLEMEKEKGVDFVDSNLYYDHDEVPHEGHFYLPMACQQCKNPPCVKSCPVGATFTDPDGIVVIDYNWCIGCRYCQAACPYWARHFNFTRPALSKEDLNPDMAYFSNRPRRKGVMEKCHFCLHRTRKGRYPACVEVCPTGARKFGNVLDPDSEISYVLKNRRVFILKEEVGTLPRFFYYFDV